jgi:VWFA-related protein
MENRRRSSDRKFGKHIASETVLLMSHRRLPAPFGAALVVLMVLVGARLESGWLGLHAQERQESPTSPSTAPPDDQGFRFRGRLDLVHVTATVSDRNGRFVPGLTRDDFSVFEDGRPQAVDYFSAERVPVSLGIVLDTSGSMAGEKIASARRALDRFQHALLGQEDEVFLYRFSDAPTLLQGWTDDPSLLTRALGRAEPHGGTALYDAVAEAIPMAASGSRRKKALLIISDGNDTSSQTSLREVRDLIRQSELLVYAVGIDGDEDDRIQRQGPPRAPFPPRRPFPPIRGRGGWPVFSPQIVIPRQPQPLPPRQPGGQPFPPRTGGAWQGDQRVNGAILRSLTDDSGGRTEIIHDARDLDPATEGIAAELNQQYFLGYPSAANRDGRYHRIRVEVKNADHRVRARAGYVAN